MSSALVTPLSQLSSLLASTNGRDRVLGIFDYLSRAGSYYTNEKSPNAPMFKALEANLLMARRIFRLGRFLEFILGYLRVMRTVTDPVRLALEAGKALGYANWLILDNLVTLAKLKVISDKNMAYRDTLSAKFWILGIICTILINVKTIVDNSKKNKPTPTTEYLTLTRATLDLAVPGFKLDVPIIKLFIHNRGLMGLAGAISMSIQTYLLWPQPPK